MHRIQGPYETREQAEQAARRHPVAKVGKLRGWYPNTGGYLVKVIEEAPRTTRTATEYYR